MNTINREAQDLIQMILRGLLTSHPFFSALALRLVQIEDAKRETVASNGKVLLYNPEWVANTSPNVVRAAIARVVLACALKHHTRRGERKKAVWQEASRRVTIPILLDAGLITKDTGGDNRDIVSVYNDLIQNYVEVPGQDTSGHMVYDEEKEKGKGGRAKFVNDPHQAGEIDDSPSLGESENAVKDEEQSWDSAGHQAIQLAKAAGKTSGLAEETIRASHKNPADWKEILRDFLTEISKADYSWVRPNRRFVADGIYLPSMETACSGRVVFAIDTSGSLSTEDLRDFWAELREAVEVTGLDSVTIIQCDTEIKSIEHYDVSDLPIHLNAKGRWGTEYYPVFEEIKKMPQPPNALVYFTDLCISDSDIPSQPDYPVIWAVQGGLHNPEMKPDLYGMRVNL